ncbi:DUF6274 family protein [Streptomyces sp. NPDC048639]|uniref:DUF6274 family protein n=1 Tax=Streptomyces sp. NPDC048639 TaxID=3365581 RepID=UPI00371EBA63
MMPSARHETRALLRAHLSAATRYRHLTGHCPVCRQLQRLAMEPTAAEAAAIRAGSTPNRNAPKATESPRDEGQEHPGDLERNPQWDEGPSAH